MPDENQKKPKLVFDVMPAGEQHSDQNPAGRQQTAQPADQAKHAQPQEMPRSMNFPSKYPIKYILIGIGIVALAVGGYFGYMWVDANYLNKEEEVINQPPPQPTLPQAFMLQYFGSAVCEDESICGTNADPDSDGLTNLKESELSTNPLNFDSDHDGLADNDEVRVYETEPIIADTDGDGFEDGAELKNGFSPKVASANPASSIERQIVQENIEKYPLHEATSLFLSLTTFTTRFGAAEESGEAGLSIGLPQNWAQDQTSINPMIFTGSSASSTLVLSKSKVVATSTTDSLIEAAVTATQSQYENVERNNRLEEESYTIGGSDVRKLSFSFTDAGRSYGMEVIYVRSGETLVTAAIIASDMAWINLETLGKVMLTSARIVE